MIASRARSAHLSRKNQRTPDHVTRRSRSGTVDFFSLILHPCTVRSSLWRAGSGRREMLNRFSGYINILLDPTWVNRSGDWREETGVPPGDTSLPGIGTL